MDKTNYQRAVVRATSSIRRYFASRSHDPEEIEDLTQEAIASLLESSRRYRDACSFATWTYSICRNVYGKHVYYAVRRRKLARSLQLEYDNQTQSSAGPSDASLACSRRSALETALARLDAYDRRLYRLYYQERLSVSKVSDLLGRSDGTVKWQLSRLRKRLREAILEE